MSKRVSTLYALAFPPRPCVRGYPRLVAKPPDLPTDEKPNCRELCPGSLRYDGGLVPAGTLELDKSAGKSPTNTPDDCEACEPIDVWSPCWGEAIRTWWESVTDWVGGDGDKHTSRDEGGTVDRCRAGDCASALMKEEHCSADDVDECDGICPHQAKGGARRAVPSRSAVPPPWSILRACRRIAVRAVTRASADPGCNSGSPCCGKTKAKCCSGCADSSPCCANENCCKSVKTATGKCKFATCKGKGKGKWACPDCKDCPVCNPKTSTKAKANCCSGCEECTDSTGCCADKKCCKAVKTAKAECACSTSRTVARQGQVHLPRLKVPRVQPEGELLLRLRRVHRLDGLLCGQEVLQGRQDREGQVRPAQPARSSFTARASAPVPTARTAPCAAPSPRARPRNAPSISRPTAAAPTVHPAARTRPSAAAAKDRAAATSRRVSAAAPLPRPVA